MSTESLNITHQRQRTAIFSTFNLGT